MPDDEDRSRAAHPAGHGMCVRERVYNLDIGGILPASRRPEASLWDTSRSAEGVYLAGDVDEGHSHAAPSVYLGPATIKDRIRRYLDGHTGLALYPLAGVTRQLPPRWDGTIRGGISVLRQHVALAWLQWRAERREPGYAERRRAERVARRSSNLW